MQGTTKSPALFTIFLKSGIMVSDLRTDMAYASDKFFDCGFVDEIF